MNLHKIIKIVAAILSLIGAILLVMIITSEEELVSAYAASEDTSMVDQMIYISYIIFAIVLLFVLFFVIKNIFTSVSTLKTTLIGAGAFLAVLVISYLVSGGDTNVYLDQKIPVTEGLSHIVGAGIISFYILGALAIASILVSGLKRTK